MIPLSMQDKKHVERHFFFHFTMSMCVLVCVCVCVCMYLLCKNTIVEEDGKCNRKT